MPPKSEPQSSIHRNSWGSLCGEGACSRLSAQHSHHWGRCAAQREQAPSPHKPAPTGFVQNS
ncbi:hypothetical protein EI534_13860 [Pseudomonas frederiksbergensis]|nr:hypothetical protein [Pseudomonas frederiksbergensis]